MRAARMASNEIAVAVLDGRSTVAVSTGLTPGTPRHETVEARFDSRTPVAAHISRGDDSPPETASSGRNAARITETHSRPSGIETSRA